MTISETTTQAPASNAADVYAALLRGDAPFILDVRNPDDVARWRVEGRTGLEWANVPYYEFIEDEEAAAARIPANREVLVVCAKEGSSQYVAEILRARGIAASYLEGGILSWGHLYDTRDVVVAPWGKIVQVTRPARGDISFVLISDGMAAVIDPLRHIEHYTGLIAAHDARLHFVLDTHVHADHISGGPALSQASGAPYFVHPYDAIHPIDMLPATISYTPLQEGLVCRVGQLTLKAIWYPGHTLGQVNFLAVAPDGRRYLFTGDGIFIRSFGRPDLGGRGEAWTPMLYTSMYERLPQLIDDATMILPSHFSVLDESNPDGCFVASYGELKQSNPLINPRSLEEFTSFVLSNLPHFPPQYVEIKRVNIGISNPTEAQAEELELGKNICALSGAAN